MITKEEVQVLQEVIAKQCALAVPYAVAETALYEVENYHLKRLEESMAKWTAGSTCGHANADPPEPYRHLSDDQESLSDACWRHLKKEKNSFVVAH
jgi:hypothetical protein